MLTRSRVREYLSRYWQPLALIALAVTSKFIGFLRNAFIAYFFGASAQSDLLGILMFPTDFVTAYLINQTIITALTIFFSRDQSESGAKAVKREIFLRTFHFYRVILTVASVVLATVMIIVYPNVPWQYSVLAAIPGVFYGMAGIIQSYLNYNRVFLWPGAQELIGHVVLLLGIVFAAKFGIYWYVVVMIFVGLLRILVMYPDLRKLLMGKPWIRELFGVQKVHFERELLVYIGPVLFTFILSGVPGFLILQLLNTAGEGYIAAYNYATKLTALFNPIFVIPLTTYLIPTMQRWIEEKRSVVQVNTVAFVLIGSMSLAFATLLAVQPEFIINIIYARGQFDHQALWLTSKFLKYQAFAVVGYALMYYLLQLTLLYNKPKRLMASFIVGTLLIIALLYLLPFAPYVTVGVALTVGVMGSVGVLIF
jgi:putative peptidoglycan lipid II flippase